MIYKLFMLIFGFLIMKNKAVLKAPKTIIPPAIETPKIISLLLGTLLTCESITLTIICLLTMLFELSSTLSITANFVHLINS